MSVTTEQFRRLALGCPEAEEGAHHGHADFRYAGRVFATLQPGGTGMVRVPPATQKELVTAHGDRFRPASGAWGRAGCTLLQLDAVDRAVLADAMAAAWQFAAAMAAARPSKKKQGKK